MKQKSLRQLANELGVSASYLSQVRNGKRPPSQKVLSMLLSKKQSLDTLGISTYNSTGSAGMAEMADAADLKSAGAILVGSSPSPGTSGVEKWPG
jgi:transcriptional regulator with XRE-family HTH domain